MPNFIRPRRLKAGTYILKRYQIPSARGPVWTYVVDETRPNIGKDGNVDFGKGANWKKLSDEGWVLKVAPSSNTYVFERCQ